tara:strand:- start:76 stop:651 length:576 start_codon:yes stop_codon:yes gene_type:complete
MIKNKYLFLIILLLIVLVIDYSFFYKKIFNYKNNLNYNYNFIVLTGGDNRVKKSLKIFFLIKNKNKNLFISGVGKGFNKKTLKKLAQKNLHYNKIIDCCIQIEGISSNTFSNAVESLKWVKSKKINSFVLLTNNYHMPRAMLEFKSIFNDIKITPYVFIDENKVWWKTKINYISEYFKYKLTYLRINLLQF